MMRLLLILALAGLCLGQSAPAGTPGVEDDTCWKNSSGKEVNVRVKGTQHGDQKVTVKDTDTDKSGEAEGTPDRDGGCKESSAVTVSGTRYRVKAGKMQFKNKNDAWINMSKTDCAEEMSGGSGVDGDELGSLPKTGPPIIGMLTYLDSGVIVSLP